MLQVSIALSLRRIVKAVAMDTTAEIRRLQVLPLVHLQVRLQVHRQRQLEMQIGALRLVISRSHMGLHS